MSDHNLCSICGGYLFNNRPCQTCSKEKSELASAPGSGWSVIDLGSPFFWGVGRPATAEEQTEAVEAGCEPGRPMSILGICNGVAAVDGKGLARLISAAPELFAACAATMKLMDALIRDGDACQLDANLLWSQAHDAVAKALGQNTEVSSAG